MVIFMVLTKESSGSFYRLMALGQVSGFSLLKSKAFLFLDTHSNITVMPVSYFAEKYNQKGLRK